MNPVRDVDLETEKAIHRLHGDHGVHWLAELPHRLARLTNQWTLQIETRKVSTASLIAYARSTQFGEVVLKIAISEPAFLAELTALEAFGGSASARVLDTTPTDQAMLLERVMPGESLSTLALGESDGQATSIAADLVRTMRSTVHSDARSVNLPMIGDEALRTIDTYRTAQRAPTRPIPTRTLDVAEGVLRELHESQRELSILHGDLHHDNILRSDRASWLAIDPKGRIGDPASELAAFLRNPITVLAGLGGLRRFLARRIDQFVDHLGDDPTRVHGWAQALAVVAACWQLEDQEPGWEQWLLVADALA